ILRIVHLLQPSTWTPVSSHGLTKALPTAGAIAQKLKKKKSIISKLLRYYEKKGYVISRKVIASEVSEPSYIGKKEEVEKGKVTVYALTKKGRERLRYLDENKDIFSRIWMRKWLYR
ncbi:MAG: hypothetical protein ACXQTS_04275, partial [Candidatus Methanospirareceae archaeon]